MAEEEQVTVAYSNATSTFPSLNQMKKIATQPLLVFLTGIAMLASLSVRAAEVHQDKNWRADDFIVGGLSLGMSRDQVLQHAPEMDTGTSLEDWTLGLIYRQRPESAISRKHFSMLGGFGFDVVDIEVSDDYPNLQAEFGKLPHGKKLFRIIARKIHTEHQMLDSIIESIVAQYGKPLESQTYIMDSREKALQNLSWADDNFWQRGELVWANNKYHPQVDLTEQKALVYLRVSIYPIAKRIKKERVGYYVMYYLESNPLRLESFNQSP